MKAVLCVPHPLSSERDGSSEEGAISRQFLNSRQAWFLPLKSARVPEPCSDVLSRVRSPQSCSSRIRVRPDRGVAAAAFDGTL